MRQSLEVLQANSLELSQLIQQTMLENPVLEISTPEEELISENISDAEHDAETLSNLDDDYREDQIIHRDQYTTDQSTIDYLYDSIVAPRTLQQHLTDQLDAEEAPLEIKEAGYEIIAHINDRGFLDQPVSSLAITSRHPLHILEKALVRIQHFEPAGVGAEDLRECLLIQLKLKKMLGSIEFSIIDQFLTDLVQKKFPHIAKELKTTTERITEAAEVIATLTPDPGASYDPTANPYILPDLFIERNQLGEWTVRLSNEHIPSITINDEYKDLMATSTDKTARTFLKNNIRDGKNLIKAVTLRQDTLLKIAEQLLLKQSEYFEHGKSHLKPLTMNAIAEVIEVHPATISRAVAGKYVQTPHGLIELRTFFTSGFQTKDGTQLSNASVKETIQQLIQEEPASKPLSDSKLEKLLKEKGLKVARRTIAKYREQLGILPSHLRKSFD
eukprot:Seg14153.2 transcript_id=Seg14153.2/GoldUCD/mRNA.D3Y31 product="RNA polymerase sigma-54 factor" protein_id=Seg14153.2/GoldUCD/D3Y31